MNDMLYRYLITWRLSPGSNVAMAWLTQPTTWVEVSDKMDKVMQAGGSEVMAEVLLPRQLRSNPLWQ